MNSSSHHNSDNNNNSNSNSNSNSNNSNTGKSRSERKTPQGAQHRVLLQVSLLQLYVVI